MTKGYPDWLRAFLLLGKHADDYLPVLLGPDGSMYAVLQGEYEGALRTVKLADEGRLSALVVDSSDAWDQMLQVGNAELAARLGSIVRLDRRGTLMFMDNFDDGASKWKISTGGTGTAHALTPQYSFSGGYSLRLTAPSDLNGNITATVNLPICLATVFGLSAMLRTSNDYLYDVLELNIYTGTKLYHIRARLNADSGQIEIYNALGSWQAVRQYEVENSGDATFHMLKVVGSSLTGKYIRLLYDNAETNISAIAIKYENSTLDAKLAGTVTEYNWEGVNSILEIDDVIITANET
ncbi:MAG: hypothetical protein Q8N51_09050 [Gammaproteobacteria bacterium]|nr:hypothetical protein [Gammaproteobacteria bacterium]